MRDIADDKLKDTEQKINQIDYEEWKDNKLNSGPHHQIESKYGC